jgi:hypothetical protein
VLNFIILALVKQILVVYLQTFFEGEKCVKMAQSKAGREFPLFNFDYFVQGK